MATGALAAIMAGLALAFLEGLGRFYPPRSTWMRLRSRHGRRAVRAMRERFEALAEHRLHRRLAGFLLALVLVWIGAASLLDKRWYEVVLDILPYAFIGLALLRVPAVLRAIAARMRRYEEELGEEPDEQRGDDGTASTIAL